MRTLWKELDDYGWEWITNTNEGKKCADLASLQGNTIPIFLKNRLHYAFMEGAKSFNRLSNIKESEREVFDSILLREFSKNYKTNLELRKLKRSIDKMDLRVPKLYQSGI